MSANAALDALIRLNADLPDAVLKALLDPQNEHFDAALILGSRSQHADLLMGLLDQRWNTADWVHLNEALVKARPPGYAARLLREWTIQLSWPPSIDGWLETLCYGRPLSANRSYPPPPEFAVGKNCVLAGDVDYRLIWLRTLADDFDRRKYLFELVPSPQSIDEYESYVRYYVAQLKERLKRRGLIAEGEAAERTIVVAK